MEASIDLSPSLRFLDDLHQNNNKPWFEKNRPVYEKAREAFEGFVDHLINELRETDQLGALSAKDCVARIYRDIRFSKDKSPYKTGFGAHIAPGGRKGTRLGYYVHLQPKGQTILAGGLYAPDPERLANFRRAIDQDARRFKEITREETFLDTFGPIRGERLKTAPQGYDRSHPEIDLLQLKQVTVGHKFSDQDVLAPAFPARAVDVCRTMKPFLEYLNGVLERD